MSVSYTIVDGSMGAMMLREGVVLGAVPEEANLTHPETVRKLHRQYVSAGASIVETLSLGANTATLADKGREQDLETFVRAAVENARAAAGEHARVALSAGPTGRMLAPLGETEPEEIYEAYLAQMKIGKSAGADLAMIETQNDLTEARLAALAAKKAGLPVILSMTMETGGRTMMGNSPEAVAAVADALAVEAVGVNCVGDIDMLVSVVEKLAAATDLPILVMPNAGNPELIDGRNVYTLTPDEYEQWITRLMAAGASYLGGCCGTGPEHIERIRPLTEGKSPAVRTHPGTRLASARAAIGVEEALQDPFSYTPAADADPYDAAEDLLDAEEASCILLDLSELDESSVRDLCLNALSSLSLPVVFRCEDESVLRSALLNTPGVCGVVTSLSGIAETMGAVRVNL